MPSFAVQQPWIALLGLLALILLLSTAIMRTLARLAGPSRLRLALLFVPGVVVHELAHAAACLLTGTRIRRIVLWNGRGGCVEHDRPRLAVLQPLLSFFPLPVGVAVLLLAGRQFQEGDAGRNALLLWLMVSVGATLAPSGEDWRSALFGGAVLGGLLAGFGVLRPAWREAAEPTVRALLPHGLQVVVLLGAILLGLKVVAMIGRRR